MDMDRLFDKLDAIDNKLDRLAIKHESRLSILETKQESTSGQIRILITVALSAILSALGFLAKTLFTRP